MMNNSSIFKNESATHYSAHANIIVIVNCVVNAVLMLIAIIGNSLVVAAIFRTPILRSPFTTLLCNLAISDLFVGLLVQPLYIVIELTDYFSLELIWSLMTYAFSGVSLCTMTTISLDRFAALHYHMRYVTMVTTTRVVYALILVWLVLFLSLGIYLWNINLYFLIASVFTMICLLLSSLCYIRIFQIVKRHKAQIQAQQQAVQNTDNNLNVMRLKKSTMNTFVFYIVLILCNFPMFISFILLGKKMESVAQKWSIYATIVFLNSSINPILYCWRLSDLRSAIAKTAKKMFCNQPGQS